LARSERLAILTNFLAPYRLPLMRELRNRFEHLSILISTPTEAVRAWPAHWGDLPVFVQRNVTIPGTWRHPHEFVEPLSIQIPYDTIPRLARFRPDVIITGELGARTLQAALYCKFVHGSPLVVWATLSEITEQGRGRLRGRLRRWLLNSADAVIVNGESGARYVKQFGVNTESVFCVPQTTEIQAFLNIPLDRSAVSRYRLLYSGQLINRKGLYPFLSCVAAWAEQHNERRLEFWFAGTGSQSESLAEFRCPRNLELRFLGHVPYDRLPEVYREAGIFAFPTLADEWGLVTVEAMAAGLPVLGSRCSQAVEELVVDGRNGWIFRPDDREGIGKALDRALGASHVELDNMGECARNDVRALTPVVMADRMTAAIDYALENRSLRS
jgi:glycosyltransferase involved in cell wall biosynthesis